MLISHEKLIQAYAAYHRLSASDEDIKGICFGFNCVFLNAFFAGDQALHELRELLNFISLHTGYNLKIIEKVRQSVNQSLPNTAKNLSSSDTKTLQSLAALFDQIAVYHSPSKYTALYDHFQTQSYLKTRELIASPSSKEIHLLHHDIAALDQRECLRLLTMLEIIFNSAADSSRFAMSVNTGSHQISVVYLKDKGWSLADINDLSLPLNFYSKENLSNTLFASTQGVAGGAHAILSIKLLSNDKVEHLISQIQNSFTSLFQPHHVKRISATGTSLLYLACERGHQEKVKKILVLDRAVNRANTGGVTPLSIASEAGNADIIQDLLDAGANANVIDFAGITPLSIACQNGHIEVVAKLLAHGANPKVKYQGFLPKDIAKLKGHIDIVRLMDEFDSKSSLYQSMTRYFNAFVGTFFGKSPPTNTQSSQPAPPTKTAGLK